MNVAYNPFTYNPRVAAFFTSGIPDAVASAIAQQPQLGTHIKAVWSFLGWMRETSPDLYNAITNRRPDLVDPVAVVAGGKLTPKGPVVKPHFPSYGLRGMGDIVAAGGNSDYMYTGDPGMNYTIGDNATSSVSPAVQTSWGADLLSTIKSIAPAYLQLQSQKSLLDINIQRAQQGLPPIDSGAVAPTVNVGMSPGIQQLGYIAVGGLVLVGLFAAFKAKR